MKEEFMLIMINTLHDRGIKFDYVVKTEEEGRGAYRLWSGVDNTDMGSRNL